MYFTFVPKLGSNEQNLNLESAWKFKMKSYQCIMFVQSVTEDVDMFSTYWHIKCDRLKTFVKSHIA